MSLCVFKFIGIVHNLVRINLSTSVFKLFKQVGTFFSLSISNLSTSDFKPTKSVIYVYGKCY